MAKPITYVGLDVSKDMIVADTGLPGEVCEHGNVADTPCDLEGAGCYGEEWRSKPPR